MRKTSFSGPLDLECSFQGTKLPSQEELRKPPPPVYAGLLCARSCEAWRLVHGGTSLRPWSGLLRHLLSAASGTLCQVYNVSVPPESVTHPGAKLNSMEAEEYKKKHLFLGKSICVLWKN